jgi:ATP-dependent RNA helicase RhlE
LQFYLLRAFHSKGVGTPVKERQTMQTGTTIWYDAKKGIGFVNPDDGGDDVFVHMRALKASGLKQIKEGDRVAFELAEDPETGRSAAANISILTPEEAALLKKPAAVARAPQPKAEKPKSDASAFADLGLNVEIVRTLGFMDYTTPTPIQAQAIPALIKGRDIVGLAQTGTGKTAAFCLPILQNLLDNPIELKKRASTVVIMSPTRELALQIHKALSDFGKRMPFKFAAVIGGAPIRKQIRTLEKGVDVLVATPGRLEDLVSQKALRLDQTNVVVLDEADQMMDIGFMPAIKRILALTSKSRQTLLFSATMPKAIKELTRDHLNDPVEVTVAPVSSTAERIDQSLMFLTKGNKGVALERISKANLGKRIIVFARTKHGSDKLVKWLATQDVKADAIHGNKSQGQRQRALLEFRKGTVPMLIATDIAARGIDIPGVEVVVNFDLPNVPESYVHRIGRTARAGASGRAISFCAPDEYKQLRDIQKLLGTEIREEHISGLTAAPEMSFAPDKTPRSKRRSPNKGKPRAAGGGGRPAGGGGRPTGGKPSGPKKHFSPGGRGKPKR